MLQRLIAEAALDRRAASLGLAISDDAIAAAVRADPSLQDASGEFSRARFDAALRDSGLSERGFFVSQSKAYLRQQIELALVDGLGAPKSLVDALARVERADARDRLCRLTAVRGGRNPGALERAR